jgi:hypothetical protein
MATSIEINSGGPTPVVSQESLEAFKSVYYLLKSKRDTDIKVFNENKVFSKLDLIDLNTRISNKLKNHVVNSSVTNVSVNLSSRECQDFGLWASFENHNWHHIASRTNSITFEWDFNVIMPNQQYANVPQTHTIKVRIGSNLRPNEIFHIVMNGGEDHEIDEVAAEMICKIDFVNTSLCEDIKHTVASWYEALPKSAPTSKFAAQVKRHRGKIELFVISMSLLMCFGIINLTIRAIIPNLYLGDPQSQIKWTLLFISITIPIFYTIISISQFFASKIIATTINRFRSNPQILLTKGDENKVSEAKSANEKILKELAFKLGITIAVNVIIVAVFTVLPRAIMWLIRYYSAN